VHLDSRRFALALNARVSVGPSVGARSLRYHTLGVKGSPPVKGQRLYVGNPLPSEVVRAAGL
jgi:hypothetical protein